MDEMAKWVSWFIYNVIDEKYIFGLNNKPA